MNGGIRRILVRENERDDVTEDTARSGMDLFFQTKNEVMHSRCASDDGPRALHRGARSIARLFPVSHRCHLKQPF
jgi:hypothetical protein